MVDDGGWAVADISREMWGLLPTSQRQQIASIYGMTRDFRTRLIVV